MAFLAPLTQPLLVRLPVPLAAGRRLGPNARPHFEPVHNPLRVGAVQSRPAQRIARLAALMEDPRVVPRPGVLPNPDGDALAGPPPLAARGVGALEAAHDGGVVVFDVAGLLVGRVKGETEPVPRQEMRYLVVEVREHGPGLGPWRHCRCRRCRRCRRCFRMPKGCAVAKR
ncbi:uncharacterized protein MAM_07553 [Metarhizium album ARSEF 1941]|uniref:Uncharacterized protein n=1 Tax=Metarhizium album (strain ARSEF 1941) TaxID=1081103 RepID=A0A0B2WMC7_METAS|nr:uncharacterized protein MAM_07553 [Metarhizium album ARSEF 1941]KHN94647.1 hypothetical protein MAM_07553 [Metarhizium album ARSEF 1941]